MDKNNLLTAQVANKIMQLKAEKKLTNRYISQASGISEAYLGDLLRGKKRFNLIHIEKICIALDYPVAKLFEEDVCLEEEKQIPPASAQDNKVLLDIFADLTPAAQGDVISFAWERRIGERRRAEEEAAASPKKSAVPKRSGERYSG